MKYAITLLALGLFTAAVSYFTKSDFHADLETCLLCAILCVLIKEEE
jgi:hypothetical protein